MNKYKWKLKKIDYTNYKVRIYRIICDYGCWLRVTITVFKDNIKPMIKIWTDSNFPLTPEEYKEMFHEINLIVDASLNEMRF